MVLFIDNSEISLVFMCRDRCECSVIVLNALMGTEEAYSECSVIVLNALMGTEEAYSECSVIVLNALIGTEEA